MGIKKKSTVGEEKEKENKEKSKPTIRNRSPPHSSVGCHDGARAYVCVVDDVELKWNLP